MSDLIEKARAMLLLQPTSTSFSSPNMESLDIRNSKIRGYDDKTVVKEAIRYMDRYFPDYGFYCKLKDLAKTLGFGKNRKSKTKKSKSKKSIKKKSMKKKIRK